LIGTVFCFLFVFGLVEDESSRDISSIVLFFVSGTKKNMKTVKPIIRTRNTRNVYCLAQACRQRTYKIISKFV